MKISCIVGARPQFVKVAAFARALPNTPSIIHTGQHYSDNMSAIFFEEMDIPKPDYHLGIGGLTQGAMTGRMIEHIEEILQQESPDWLVLFGDTNSTLAGAIAASKLHIPIAHVEAGLRSYNRKMPEEINRVLTDHCSTLLFTPTHNATQTLLKEGIDCNAVHEVGDIMFDAALHYKQIAQDKGVDIGAPYVLATIHRAENTDCPDRLTNIFEQLIDLSNKLQVMIPLHPRTKKALERQPKLYEACQRALHIINPVGYLEMVQLESSAQVIITDSGGVQKEAFFFKVPCITVRTETEWIELVEKGYNILVHPKKQHTLLKAYEEMLNKTLNWDQPLYGDGNAANKMAKILIEKR